MYHYTHNQPLAALSNYMSCPAGSLWE